MQPCKQRWGIGLTLKRLIKTARATSWLWELAVQVSLLLWLRLTYRDSGAAYVNKLTGEVQPLVLTLS